VPARVLAALGTPALASCLVLSTVALGAEDDPRPSDAAEPRPSPTPAATLFGSVDGAVDRFLRARQPCPEDAGRHVPCFPVEVVRRAPDASVEESLGELGSENAPSPGRPPSTAELRGQGPETLHPPGTLVGTDPVCTAKRLWRWIRGRGDTYYVYRVVEPSGERMALYDHPLAAEDFSATPDVSFEFLGQYGGECAAVAAYRRAARAGSAAGEADTP